MLVLLNLHKYKNAATSNKPPARDQTEISKYFIGHDKRSTKGSERACPSISKINQVYTVYLSCLSLSSFFFFWHKHSVSDEQDRSLTGLCWANHRTSEAKSHG